MCLDGVYLFWFSWQLLGFPVSWGRTPKSVPASYKAVTTLSSLLEEMKSTMTHNAICIDLEIIPFYCARAADLAEGARRDMLLLTEQ